eukprot:CAMPEP_0119151956 /NCGR_PEP_ID=MMETSP1310-20130426/47072_1 /TAXON_ID=464262 /ORGANISM="Genus nov. species nov., Strain RCC2339" /LENGTH=50 /DNA_ID=CAMNT_0007144277 /DNA_START=39 /DNA_END=188 /DNA_ORIENTATION=-
MACILSLGRTLQGLGSRTKETSARVVVFPERDRRGRFLDNHNNAVSPKDA